MNNILKIIITGKMPSLNEYINKINSNRFLGNLFKQNLENELCKQITKQVREQGFNAPFKKPVDFYITYYEKNKKRDKDNIASSKKYILDALVKSGVLQNDGWKWVGNFKEEFKIGKDYEVEITMMEKING